MIRTSPFGDSVFHEEQSAEFPPGMNFPYAACVSFTSVSPDRIWSRTSSVAFPGKAKPSGEHHKISTSNY
jgi:hypothetical protein